jgi:3-keto-disaccharide hydrolase
MHSRRAAVVAWTTLASIGALSILCAQAVTSEPPAGFTALFNGKDLSGWRGRPGGGGVFSPYVEAKFTPEERSAKQKGGTSTAIFTGASIPRRARSSPTAKASTWQPRRRTATSSFASTGCSRSQEAIQASIFAAILRCRSGIPRIRMSRRTVRTRGRAACGTIIQTILAGGRSSRRNPIGEWNTLVIKMVGTRVWVTLNDKPTVEGQVLDNFFDRTQPVLPTGSIELQTHGSEVRFRNIYIREIPEAEGKVLLATVQRTPG